MARVAAVAAVALVAGGGLAAWALLQPDDTSGRPSRSTTSTSGEEHADRSVEEAVLGFVEAYNDADCERLAGHLVATAPLPGDEDCGRWREHRDQVRAFGGGFASDEGDLALPATVDVSPTGSGTASATIHWSAARDSASNEANRLTETVALREEDGEWRLEHALEATAYIELVARMVEEPEPGYQLWGAWVVTPDRGLPHEVRNFDPAWDDGVDHLGPGFQRGVVAAYEAPDADDNLLVMLYEFADPTAAESYSQELATRIATATGPGRAAPVLEGVRACGDQACTTARDAIAVQPAGSLVVGGRAYDDEDPPPVEQARSRADAILADQVAHLSD